MVWDPATSSRSAAIPPKDLEAGQTALRPARQKARRRMDARPHRAERGRRMAADQKRRGHETGLGAQGRRVVPHRPDDGRKSPPRRTRSGNSKQDEARESSCLSSRPMKATLVDAAGEGRLALRIEVRRIPRLAMKSGRQVQTALPQRKGIHRAISGNRRGRRRLQVREAISTARSSRSIGRAGRVFNCSSPRTRPARPPLAFYIFDLLRTERQELDQAPLTERRRALREVLRRPPSRSASPPPIEGDPTAAARRSPRARARRMIGKEARFAYEPGAAAAHGSS